jgi:hypothetical protein
MEVGVVLVVGVGGGGSGRGGGGGNREVGERAKARLEAQFNSIEKREVPTRTG